MEKLLSPISCSLHTALESLAGQLGTYFQIRDDYKNLTEEVDTFLCGQFEPRLTLAVQYTSQKDFCKDLNSRSPWSMLCLPGPTTSICEESCNNLG